MSDIDRPQINPEFDDIKCISPNLASDDYLQLIHLDFSDFEGKKVASIGGGFGILEMNLAKQGIEVEMIDPIYSSPELIQTKWQQTYNWISDSYADAQKHKYGILEQCIETLTIEIGELLKDKNINIDELKKKQEELKEKQELKKRKNKLFHNKFLLKQNLEERSKEKPENLILNPSRGDDIRNIPEGSKDYIFINHILNYFPDKIDIFLEQADKILKDGGTIFIVDYVDGLSELQNFFKKHGTYHILGGTFCGSLKKGEFKNFGK